jgi:hypothetical protein
VDGITNKPNIHEDKIDLARMCIEHRATWMALTYEEMEKAGVDAEKLTRAAVSRCGLMHGAGIKSRCSNPDDVSVFNMGLSRQKIELLCDIAMDGERGIAAAMGLKFELGDTISHGCQTCNLLFSK